jgi:hypothetical protein
VTAGRSSLEVREKFCQIIKSMDYILNIAEDQLKSFPSHHVRIELFFDLSCPSLTWPDMDLNGVIKYCSQSDFAQYITKMRKSVMIPLKNITLNEAHSGLGTPDLAHLSPVTKTCLIAKAELAVLLMNPMRFVPRMGNFWEDKIQAAGVFHIPPSDRVDISDHEKVITGLSYGVKVDCLVGKHSSPQSAHTGFTHHAQAWSNILASQIASKVFVPKQFIKISGNILCLFQHASEWAQNEADESVVNVDYTPGSCGDVAIFAPLDYQKIANNFSAEQRELLATELSKQLINLYEIEMHYHLMVPKKGRSGRGLNFPRRKKGLKDLPTTVSKVSDFKRAENLCNTIHFLDENASDMAAERVNTPGK